MARRRVDRGRAAVCLVALVALVALISGCGSAPVPSPARQAPDPTVVPPDRCPSRPAGGASPPALTGDFVPEAETHRIVQRFLDGLARLYDDPASVDRCALFTDDGWASAVAADWKTRDVVAGELRFVETHTLRLAIEIENDPAAVPARLSFDVVFDLAPGATIRDVRTDATVATTVEAQRTGLALLFIRDGADWRVDHVGPIGAEDAAWAVLPGRVHASKRCSGFIDDAKRTVSFDEDPNRTWCDGGASGRLIERPDELEMLTRYPCDRGADAVLMVPNELGQRIDRIVRREYVRDPADEFLANGWIAEPYDGDAPLPRTAYFSGWSNGNIALWVDPATWDEAAYLVRGDVVERWPRVAQQWGYIDCN